MSEVEKLSQDYHDYLDEDGMIHADPRLMLGEANKPDEITKGDVMKVWFRWWWCNEVPHTFDRMIAPSLCFGLMPVLKKLYKNPVFLGEAYQRHLQFFNTQAVWGGGIISGITMSLEEERAKALNAGEDALDASMIQNTKIGLMGPLAGVGDSIDSGTVQYIFISLFLGLAQEGNPLGAVLPFICFATATFIYGYLFTRMGYTMGRRAALEVMKGGRIKSIIDALGVLGLFMMGCMAASYVKLTTPIAADLSGKPFVLQDTLDGILPGILPLCAVMALFFFFQKKGMKVTQAMLGFTAILIVLAVIGIL
ncbi:PTS system mannose/fructose/sorbose family transporter subunit IID [Collinsella ihumii]|uniref:PTS system mannose/fructose/sorbose family transporter subunit IID n=1 Tax=Collinsella ihumii TaxID=1720204 RepID=A0ABT7XDT9_9ACTN|nr:PTS system mannose/fructose/sorbose family transporter subunit IID [Collinsella ihumii]MBM6688710.1 PTS system mannose/fructose/sorbose family transporter subunit IID [Collinsella tanakaei]MBM6777136.1 PTS system mannose/fructose/sorbose family transporter subunit IID [Collinsella tanakaei]MBM6905749.1 PTS system mannose/fructose/sorbose family transporter subunit IID [Collinsella tanakaei]MDN0063541.1 PTS system mannose/fructose/sorbose family transporter subunit IID [Collinsella ihumii]